MSKTKDAELAEAWERYDVAVAHYHDLCIAHYLDDGKGGPYRLSAKDGVETGWVVRAGVYDYRA